MKDILWAPVPIWLVYLLVVVEIAAIVLLVL